MELGDFLELGIFAAMRADEPDTIETGHGTNGTRRTKRPARLNSAGVARSVDGEFDPVASLDALMELSRTYARNADLRRASLMVQHEYRSPGYVGPRKPKRQTDVKRFGTFCRPATKHPTLPVRNHAWRMVCAMTPGRTLLLNRQSDRMPLDKGRTGAMSALRNLVKTGFLATNNPLGRAAFEHPVWLTPDGIVWRAELIRRYRAGAYVPGFDTVRGIIERGGDLADVMAYDERQKWANIRAGRIKSHEGVRADKRWELATAIRQARKAATGPLDLSSQTTAATPSQAL